MTTCFNIYRTWAHTYINTIYINWQIMKKQKIDYFRTDLQGTIVIGTDGNRYYTATEKNMYTATEKNNT